jgi:hypothetical protein
VTCARTELLRRKGCIPLLAPSRVVRAARDRAQEVHRTGSSRAAGQESVELGVGEHRFRDATVTVSGAGAVIHKSTYNYTINGAERKATEACAEHLGLLRKMVTEFEAAHAGNADRINRNDGSDDNKRAGGEDRPAAICAMSASILAGDISSRLLAAVWLSR